MSGKLQTQNVRLKPGLMAPLRGFSPDVWLSVIPPAPPHQKSHKYSYCYTFWSLHYIYSLKIQEI